MPRLPFSFDHPLLLALAGAGVIAAILVDRRRRAAIHRLTRALAGVALLLLLLAAGGLAWHRPATSEIAVMVDLSPSTRTALYRQRAQLDQRIRQLLGDAPYRLIFFSDRNVAVAGSGPVLQELASDRTVFAPPAATAVLLFSDCRFDLPATAPPTFIVADPSLDVVTDAAVERLEMRGSEIAATVRVSGPPRRITIQGAATRPAQVVEPGQSVLLRPAAPGASLAIVQFAAGDLWPENDALSMPPVEPMRSQRWLVTAGRAAPSARWRTMDTLPADEAAYLAAAVIVLDNLPASSLSQRQQELLARYIRDLGGALLIAGGDRAFSAGRYPGSILESLSPLASSPPQPAIHWMLLADCSGSMGEAVGSTTKWALASSAVSGLIRHLPPEDPVTIGCFARDLSWWSAGRSARSTSAEAFPPAGVAPSGPTNLAPALEQIARQSDGSLVTHILVVSDTDTKIPDPEGLARRLADKKIHLHVLAIGQGEGTDALERMTRLTGGSMRTQVADPAKWAAEVQELLTAAWPKRLIDSPATVRFSGELAALPGRSVAPWNRTWLKKDATLLGDARHQGQTVPLAARWSLGGEVLACAFTPTPEELEAIADRIARSPRNPLYSIAWDPGSRLRVTVDETARPRNGLKFRLELAEAADPARRASHALEQTAPGRYEAALDAPREPSFATLFLGAQVVDRIAVPARYPPEFDRIGNDYDAMRNLAARSAGRVVYASWTKPLDLPFPRQRISLAPLLSLLAAAALAGALARWRWG